MTTLPEQLVSLAGERVTIPVSITPPVSRGSVTACLATSRGGTAAHPTLERTLVWNRGEPVPPLTLFTRDVRAVWPRGGRAWVVVRYAGAVVGVGVAVVS